MDLKSAVKGIEKNGILLVFPIQNRKEPPSLWTHFFPRKKMRWEWDESGDEGVAQLWHLRERLSRSKKVVYTKWYQGRATLFSRPIFSAMLAALGTTHDPYAGLGREAREILELLESDSPLSTKILKRLSGLQGRMLEPLYNRAMRELWSRLLIVAFGEVDEGSFPSLAVGSTRLLFEDLWQEAAQLSPEEGERALLKSLPEDSLFLRYYRRTKRLQNEKPQFLK